MVTRQSLVTALNSYPQARFPGLYRKPVYDYYNITWRKFSFEPGPKIPFIGKPIIKTAKSLVLFISRLFQVEQQEIALEIEQYNTCVKHDHMIKYATTITQP